VKEKILWLQGAYSDASELVFFARSINSRMLSIRDLGGVWKARRNFSGPSLRWNREIASKRWLQQIRALAHGRLAASTRQ